MTKNFSDENASTFICDHLPVSQKLNMPTFKFKFSRNCGHELPKVYHFFKNQFPNIQYRQS